MEPTARLFRTLANYRRLRILRLLAVLKEYRVSELTRAMGLHPATVSRHLVSLSVCGIVWQRRSGSAVYYRFAEKPSNPLTMEVLSLLTRVFDRVRERDPKRVASNDQASSPEHSDAALFRLFTAFTHPRRLQIIRHLSEHGPCTQFVLTSALGMSPTALCRHMTKLSLRYIVDMQKSEGLPAYRLVPTGDDVRGVLLRSVVVSLRTSK